MSLTIVHLDESFALLAVKCQKWEDRLMDAVSIAWLAFFILFFAAVISVRRRRRSGHPGPGTSGAIYDMLNEDKRKAIEIIVEEKAEERDPETADGNLPELESPARR